jgi:hypothetical protein
MQSKSPATIRGIEASSEHTIIHIISSPSGNASGNQESTSKGAYMHTGMLSSSAFQPSRMVLEKQGLLIPPRQKGFNYMGTQRSVSSGFHPQNLSDYENCALWITNLPPTLDLAGFLAEVRTGAVYAARLQDPELGRGRTKAAKLVFMKHHAAAAFLDRVRSNHGIILAGHRMRAIWNQNGYYENDTTATRVLVIRGPEYKMSIDFWHAYFEECVVFELESFHELPSDPDFKTTEFRFARVDGQAESLYYAIGRDLDSLGLQ